MPKADGYGLVLVPGFTGEVAPALAANKLLIAWLKKQHLEHGTELASLCSGAFFIAATGLADGKKMTTHWAYSEVFKSLFPGVRLFPDRIVTDDGGIYASGGAYSSLNLVLYLLEKFCGKAEAVWASKVFQIDLHRTSQKPFVIFNGQKSHVDETVKIVLEKYFDGFAPTDEWYWASAAKPMMGFLTGIAQQDGHLHLDDPTKNYLGDGWTSTPPDKETLITLRHHLAMTIGMDDALINFCTTPACLQYLADAGTRWSYHNDTYYLMANVLEAATGKTLNQYFDEEITATTGIDGEWANSGYAKVLYSTPRDFACFGLLMLNNGFWGDTQVLDDAQFFQEMTTPSQELNKAYGYYWWINGQDSYMVPYTQQLFSGNLCPAASADMYSGVGANGQYLNIVPSKGIVLVRMGEYLSGTLSPFEYNNDFWRLINDFECAPNALREREHSAVHIYPNPVKDMLQLNLPDNIRQFSVHIFDALGMEKMVLENTTSIPVAGLPGVVYRVVVKNGRTNLNSSFFKI